MIFRKSPSDFLAVVWNWWTSLRRQRWTIHRANEKRWDESPDEQTETKASSHLQCRPLNSDEGWNFRTKDERPRDGEREMREKMEGKQIRAHLGRRPLNMHSDTVQGLYHTYVSQQVAGSCHFHRPPLTHRNGFTFLGLVGPNTLYVPHTHTHTQNMEGARSQSHSTINAHTLISSLPCVCTLQPIMGPSFSHLQIDRHASYFYLCIKAGTVFTLRRLEPCLSLRKIYLEPSRGEAEERGGRWALIKSLNENVWGSVCYFITTRPKNRMRRGSVQSASFTIFDYMHQTMHFVTITNSPRL